MMEDQLGRNERIRLEALAQSVAASSMSTSETIIHQAKKFEAYIRNDEEENQDASTR